MLTPIHSENVGVCEASTEEEIHSFELGLSGEGGVIGGEDSWSRFNSLLRDSLRFVEATRYVLIILGLVSH